MESKKSSRQRSPLPRSKRTTGAGQEDGLVVEIPAGGPGYLAGARILAVLADPPSPDGGQTWRENEKVICRAWLSVLQQHDPGWEDRPQVVVPAHLLLPLKTSERRWPAIMKRHHDRMGAAHVMVPFLAEAERQLQGAPASRRRVPSVDARIAATLEQEEERQRVLTAQAIEESPRFPPGIDNFDNRILRRSLPVIHIAVAVATFIDQSQKNARLLPDDIRAGLAEDVGGPQFSFLHFLASPELARAVVERAARIEGLLPYLPKLRPDPATVVKLRLGSSSAS